MDSYTKSTTTAISSSKLLGEWEATGREPVDPDLTDELTAVLNDLRRLRESHGAQALDDAVRLRRTLLEMTRGRDFLLRAPGTRELCRLLFGPRADEQWEVYAS